jgi:multidrug efflux system outer membrane protein
MLHDVKEDRASPAKVPSAYSASGEAKRAATPWWKELQSPGFAAYVDELLTQNFDLKRGYARVKQMQAIAKKTGSARYPVVDGKVAASYNQSVFSLPEPLGDQTVESTRFPIDVSVGYEVDLWGKVASAVRASELDVIASRDDLAAMGLSLTGAAAKLWFLIREHRAHLELLDRQEKIGLDYIKVIRFRVERGLAGALDVLQQEQQLASIRARRPRHEALIQTSKHQLAILVAKPPLAGSWHPPVGLPAMGPLPGHGLPVELLKDRPDMRAALRRVNAADYRVGMAIGDQFPSLRFSASGGLSGSEPSNIFTSWIYNLASSLLAPIFDGFRRSAEVERSRAALEETVQAYGKAVLGAYAEVEDALARERAERRTMELTEKQLEAGQRTLDEATRRYQNGLSGYLPVLQALKALQELEHSRLSAQGRAWSERIGLYLALGGTWLDAEALGQGKAE